MRRTVLRGRMQLKNSPISDVYLNGMNLLLLYEKNYFKRKNAIEE
jgi:hypothetical protein